MTFGEKSSKGCKIGFKCLLFHPRMCHSSINNGECYKEDCRFMHRKGTKRVKGTASQIQPTTQKQSKGEAKTVHAPSNIQKEEPFLELIQQIQRHLQALELAQKTQASLIQEMTAHRLQQCPTGVIPISQIPGLQTQYAAQHVTHPTTHPGTWVYTKQ